MRKYIELNGEKIIDLSEDYKLHSVVNQLPLLSEVCIKAHDKGISPKVRQYFMSPEGREAFIEGLICGTTRIAPPTETYRCKISGVELTYEQAASRNFEDVRKLYKNEDYDRLILMAVYQVYYNLYSDRIHPKCMSYKKGVSVGKTARELSVQLRQWKRGKGYKIDISKFFDSVSKEALSKLLDDLDTGSLIDELVRSYYEDDRVIVNGQEVVKYKSLAQGCALGCLFADLILYDIDEELSKLNIIYYRYSDDILMIGEDADKAYQLLIEKLAQYGLSINPKKVEILYPGKWFIFLGYCFKGALISLSENKVRSIKISIKERTYCKAKQRKRPATIPEVQQMVCSVMEYLYTFSEDEAYGMAPVLFSAVNVISDLEKIDTYIKDCIRAAYTNKTDIYGIGFYPNSKHDYVVVSGKGRNVSANRVKTQSEDFLGNDLLRECGYVSLVHMYKAWLCGKPVYDMERMKMRNKEFAAYA